MATQRRCTIPTKLFKSKEEDVRQAYAEAASTFRALTDVRFKLLTIVPTLTALGTYSATDGKIGLAVLGALTTAAVWVYDLRNNQHYDALIGQAAMLEHELKVPHGSFSHRPRSWASILGLKIEHRWPIALIYAASLAAWLSVLLYAWLCHRGEPIWVRFAVAGALPISVVGLVAEVVRWRTERQQENERANVIEIVDLLGKKANLEAVKADERLADLLSWPTPKVRQKNESQAKSFDSYLNAVWEYADSQPDLKLDKTTAALVTAYLTDLPFHWIRSACTGRRRVKAARANCLLLVLLVFLGALSLIAWKWPEQFFDPEPKFPSVAPTPTCKCTLDPKS